MQRDVSALSQANLLGVLAETDHDVLDMYRGAGWYTQPRIFRLPVKGRWDGSIHEYFTPEGGTKGILARASFDEHPKSHDQLQKRLVRDVKILSRLTEQYPEEPRWWYYLGDTLSNQGKKLEAIDAFDRCASLDGWDEEAAWARFREAECWLALDSPERAIKSCAAGLAHHAGVAELAWLAGYASWVAKNYRQAVFWSQLALVHREEVESEAPHGRFGFRNLMALYEGPWDVLRFAWRELGNTDAADEAERHFQYARDRRLERNSMKNENQGNSPQQQNA